MPADLGLLNDFLRKTYGKVLMERQGLFTAFILSRDNEPFAIICVAGTATPYVYGKVVPLDKAGSLDCNTLVYSPEGLFVFAEDTGEFIVKVRDKLGRIG